MMRQPASVNGHLLSRAYIRHTTISCELVATTDADSSSPKEDDQHGWPTKAAKMCLIASETDMQEQAPDEGAMVLDGVFFVPMHPFRLERQVVV